MDDARIEWPENSGAYRFVQFYIDKEPYLAIAKGLYEKHVEIAERFLSSMEMDFDMVSLMENKGPVPKGKRYEIVGAGWVRINPYKKTALFDPRSSSTDYNIGLDRTHLEKIKSFTDWILELEKKPWEK